MLTELKQIPQISIIYRNQIQTSLKKSLKYSIFMKNTQTLKANHLSKNGVIIADDTDIVSLNVDKNNKITRTNLKNIENQTNHSINIRRKIKIYQTKTYIVTTIQENHFRTTPVTQGTNHHITQVIEEDHQNEEIHRIIHKIIIINQIVEITIQDQIPMQQNLFLDLVPNQTQGINTIPIINHETHHITETETIHIIETEVIQTTEIRITRTIDQEITHITDQTITDQTIIIKTDHEIIHKIEIQVTIIAIEIIPNHHTEIITIIIILTIATEVVHLNIKDILIKYNQI